MLSPQEFGSPQVSIMTGKAAYDDATAIERQIEAAVAALELPQGFIQPGEHVVIKPNWV
ncbi:MAG: hypothetical protein RLZZ476_2489, partial [Verrucomicrobiota bacterium]